MRLMKQVTNTIERYELLTSKDKVIVGVSGGPDSLTLLHILTRLQSEYNLQLHIAHVNHQLRGEKADREKEFVKQVADCWQIPITTKTVDTEAYRQKCGLSLEDAARQLRYKFFFNLREELNFDKVAVAHQADDQVETILMKFLRGAGLKGLGGMVPQQNKIIRPLLAVTKDQITDYCSYYDLRPRFDRTNAQPVHLRNKIRLELIPLLKDEYNSNLSSTLIRNAQIWRAEDDFLRTYAQKELKQLIIDKSDQLLRLARDKYKERHVALQRRIIREALKELIGDYQNFYHQHIQDIRQLAVSGKTGRKIELPRNIIAKLNYNQLILMNEKAETKVDYFKVKATLGQTELSQLGLVVSSKLVDSSYPWQEEVSNPNKGFFDFDKIGPEFYIRQREPGDRFQPLGLAGRKKVKDLLIDEKVPRWKRDQLPIFVTPGGQIFWLGWLRIDDRFKVTNSTEQILAIKIYNAKGESIC